MDQKEIELIESCQKGETEAFGALYDKYIKKIYDFVYCRVQHKESAEDLVSRTFMKALKRINSFRESQGTFQAWLYQIARNTVIDHYRTSRQEANVDDYWGLQDKSDVKRDTEMKLKLEEIEQYLEKLKSEQREVVIMRVWQGLSHQEIADILGKSEAGVKMLYSRTIRKLREEVPLGVLLYLVFYI